MATKPTLKIRGCDILVLFRVIEFFNDSPLALYLLIIGIACSFGGIPPMLERRRRRSIENALPGFLEAMSDGVGAGLGLQEVMMDQSRICLLYTSPSPRD